MRDIINILEGAETVRLYRGDAAEVQEFDTDKTALESLFGHGIYLSDNKRVANDYRTKGQDAETIFTMRGAKSKQEVIQRWIEKKAAKLDIHGVDHSREIAYWTQNVPYSDDGDWSVAINDLRREEKAKRIQMAGEIWKTMSRQYEVRIKLDGTGVIQKKQAGAIAAFDIPQTLLSRLLDTEGEITAKVLEALCNALDRHNDRSTARDIRQFIRNEDGYVSFRTVFTSIGGESPIRDEREVMEEFISDLKKMGYAGFSYLGGITMGGGYKHRAYVFWDSKLINSYRVKT